MREQLFEESKEKQRIQKDINIALEEKVKERTLELAHKNEELEEGPMEKLTAKGQVAMFRHEGFWQCMDTYRDHQLLESIWNSGKAPWKTW